MQKLLVFYCAYFWSNVTNLKHACKQVCFLAKKVIIMHLLIHFEL